jgi:hypothetical protein
MLARELEQFKSLRQRAVGAMREQRYFEALTHASRALALNADAAGMLMLRGDALKHLDRHEEALASYERALALKPQHAAAHFSRALALGELKRHEEALLSFERAQALQPELAMAHLYEGLSRLVLGDFERGWPKLEWRWRKGGPLEKSRRDFSQPLWLGGDSIAGKTLLMHGEQGLGDSIQFCRYARLAAARGASVVMEVQPPLKSVLAGVDGVSRLLAKGETLPAFDCHCPFMSLPLAFGTRGDTIPDGSAYLRSDPARVARWRATLGAPAQLRAGIVWRGRAEHKNDRNRSIPLADLAPLLAAPAQFISLQKELNAAEQRVLAAHPEVRHFGADLADTAALIEQLDVVISVDTSLAHLAAALGKPTWILLPFNPDWRWLLGRTDSAWYPAVRLFRQPAVGDWASVIGDVGRALPGLSRSRT